MNRIYITQNLLDNKKVTDVVVPGILYNLGLPSNSFDHDELGKPYLKNLPFHISISDSNDYFIFAISDEEIGIDIQYQKQLKDGFAKRFYSEYENDYLENKSTNKDLDIINIWALKEAYLKAKGIGLRQNLASFTIYMDDFRKTEQELYYKFNLLDKVENYTIAVASKLEIDEFEIIKF